jgi:hypothetical protein
VEWIEISDRLPPNDVYVLVCSRHLKTGMNFVNICKRYNQKWLDDHNEEEIDGKNYHISHWMPVPDDPSKRIERKEKEEILHKSWLCMDEYIRSTVKECLTKEEISYEIWSSLKEAVKEFLSDMDEGLFERFMSNAFSEKFDDLEITFKIKK